MREMSVTEAARNLSEVLDAVEHDREEFILVRKGKPIARLSPAARANSGTLKAFLRDHKPDPDWARDLEGLRKGLTIEDRRWAD